MLLENKGLFTYLIYHIKTANEKHFDETVPRCQLIHNKIKNHAFSL